MRRLTILHTNDIHGRAEAVARIATYGGYAQAEWGLDVEWDGTTIVREAIEEHLRRHPVIEPPAPRIDGPLRLT